MQPKHFVAFDLGATSGRTILGSLRDGELALKELTRFPNTILPLGKHYYWNIFSLYEHLCEGLRAAAREGVEITSVGIDTWGVDFAFVGKDGSLLGLPYAYRDPHTDGAPEEYFSKVLPREEVYGDTGIQIMNFNSLYQLYAMQRDHSSQLAAAERLLFMPDALSYLLTGEMVTEYTIASTSQLLNPRTKRIEPRLLEKMGLSPELFPPIVMPGHRIGTLRPELAAACGVPQLPVVAVAGHDTASAVAAVPAANERFAYLSSGTWSLMGIEVREPQINEQTERYNFTNEGGVEGTTRLLKNITGMWILEQCLRKWKDEGRDYTYPEIVKMATGAAPFRTMIDPDDASFAAPGDMPAAIRAYCERTGQPAPDDDKPRAQIPFRTRPLPLAGSVRDRTPPRHRRRIEERPAEPVHGRFARNSRNGRPFGGHCRGQHHASGPGRGMRRHAARNALADRPLHPHRELHPGRHRCMGCRLHPLQDNRKIT